MNTIIPARHFCRVGDEIWFLTRNTYALYNYSFSSKKLEYKAFPCEIEIGPYPYSSVFCYGNRIVCVPAMAKSYLIYDVSNNHFEQIKTPNTERGISFDNVVQHNNLLYCFPVHCKNPVVIFDMNELCESGSIELQQNIVSDSHGDPTSLAPHERLTDLAVAPSENAHPGAASREPPRDSPVLAEMRAFVSCMA